MLFCMRQIQKLVGLTAIACMLPIAGLAATPAVSVGKEHSLALHTDGSVLAWGSDREGQLGQGRQTCELRPGRVARLTGIRAIGTGANHAMAIHARGPAIFHLLCGEAEDEEVFCPHMIAHFNISAVQGANRQCAVQSKLHVACARGFHARR